MLQPWGLRPQARHLSQPKPGWVAFPCLWNSTVDSWQGLSLGEGSIWTDLVVSQHRPGQNNQSWSLLLLRASDNARYFTGQRILVTLGVGKWKTMKDPGPGVGLSKHEGPGGCHTVFCHTMPFNVWISPASVPHFILTRLDFSVPVVPQPELFVCFQELSWTS